MLKELENQINYLNELSMQRDDQKAIELGLSIVERLKREEQTHKVDELTRWTLTIIYSIYAVNHQYDEALKYALLILQTNVLDIDGTPYFYVGKCYYELGDAANAFKYFEEVYARGKKRAFQGYEVKYLQFYLDYKKSPIELKGQTDEKNTSSVKPENLTFEFDENGDAELNDEIYEQVTILSEQGNAAFDIDDFQGARALFESALALLPTPQTQWEAYTWLHASIGDAYFCENNFKDALESFLLSASGLDGLQNPFILLRLGQIYFEFNQFDQAEEYLLRAYILDGSEIFKRENTDKHWIYMRNKFNLEE